MKGNETVKAKGWHIFACLWRVMACTQRNISARFLTAHLRHIWIGCERNSRKIVTNFKMLAAELFRCLAGALTLEKLPKGQQNCCIKSNSCNYFQKLILFKSWKFSSANSYAVINCAVSSFTCRSIVPAWQMIRQGMTKIHRLNTHRT